MIEFINYLERMIEGCENLGGLDREKATYQTVLKEYRKQCNMPVVSNSIAIDYAKNCLKRNHDKLPLLELDEYIKQYC